MQVTNDLIDWMLTEITSGRSQADLAASLGVSVGTVHNWLERDDDTIERAARAREKSAEAWLDKGADVLRLALPRNGPIDPTAARAYEQACARRAAIRNPKYRDKQDHTLSAPDGGPVRHAIEKIEMVVVHAKPDQT